jgi:hypothetical protein
VAKPTSKRPPIMSSIQFINKSKKPARSNDITGHNKSNIFKFSEFMVL